MTDEDQRQECNKLLGSLSAYETPLPYLGKLRFEVLDPL